MYLQLADFLVMRYKVHDASLRVWVGPNFPRVFNVYQFRKDVRAEAGYTEVNHLLDMMIRQRHYALKREYNIPSHVGAARPRRASGGSFASGAESDEENTSLGSGGGGSLHDASTASNKTTHVYRATVYALSNAMTPGNK